VRDASPGPGLLSLRGAPVGAARSRFGRRPQPLGPGPPALCDRSRRRPRYPTVCHRPGVQRAPGNRG